MDRPRPDAEIVQALVNAGVSPHQAPGMSRAIREGFRLGALAAYLGKPLAGARAETHSAGCGAADPIADAAFAAGYTTFSRRSSAAAALRGLLAVPVAIVA